MLRWPFDVRSSPQFCFCSPSRRNFNVEIGGTTAGTQYDQVVVGGAATIGTASTLRGTLNVSLINGFATPATDTDFTILTASSVSGVFANVNLPSANWSRRRSCST